MAKLVGQFGNEFSVNEIHKMFAESRRQEKGARFYEIKQGINNLEKQFNDDSIKLGKLKEFIKYKYPPSHMSNSPVFRNT